MYEKSCHSPLPPGLAMQFSSSAALKVDLWNAFVDSGLLGITDDDCSVIPNILPASYLPVLRRSCSDIMHFLFRLLSLPDRELLAILPPTPVTEFLIKELGLLSHRPQRLVGSLRFDMALVGPPAADNPPKLFEVNEIGFDGSGRSSFIQETLLRLLPGLAHKVICFDTAASEARNMHRLGPRLTRFQYNSYNWEEEVTIAKARHRGVDIRLVTPADFEVEIADGCDLLTTQTVRLRNGHLLVGGSAQPPSAFQMGYSFELDDYLEAPGLFGRLVRTKTPQYSPFLTGLVAPKSILTVLADKRLRSRLVGRRAAQRLDRSILPATLLAGRREAVRRACSGLVIKYVDGMGGEKVFVGNAMRKVLRSVRSDEERYWAVQQRVHMNTLRVHGFLSRPRRVISDLGVFMHYDWNGRSFERLALGGFITRATNRSLKVNVSGGGIQVPVLFDRSR